MFDHRVQNREQFAHTSDQGDLRSFTRIAQPFVESSDHRVTSAGDQGGHVEYRSNSSPTAPDATTASESAAVTIERRDTDQSSNLFTVEVPKFRQFGNQTATNDRTDAGHTPEKIFVLTPDRALSDGLVEVFVSPNRLCFQPADMSVDSLSHILGSSTEPVSFGHNHLSKLAPAGNQRSQFQSHLVRQGAHSRAHSLTEAGQNHGIDGIGLSQLPGRFGEVSNLPRIDPTTTGSSALVRARVTQRSIPPVASNTIRVGWISPKRLTKVLMPASSLGTDSLLAEGRQAISSRALDTSMPTKIELVSKIHSSLMNLFSSNTAQPCR